MKPDVKTGRLQVVLFLVTLSVTGGCARLGLPNPLSREYFEGRWKTLETRAIIEAVEKAVASMEGARKLEDYQVIGVIVFDNDPATADGAGGRFREAMIGILANSEVFHCYGVIDTREWDRFVDVRNAYLGEYWALDKETVESIHESIRRSGRKLPRLDKVVMPQAFVMGRVHDLQRSLRGVTATLQCKVFDPESALLPWGEPLIEGRARRVPESEEIAIRASASGMILCVMLLLAGRVRRNVGMPVSMRRIWEVLFVTVGLLGVCLLVVGMVW